MSEQSIDDRYRCLNESVKSTFKSDKTVMSFKEFYRLMNEAPECYLRSSAQYAVDMMDHFGTREVFRPTGKVSRFKVFDMEFARGEGRVAGQEEVQWDVYRCLANFAREGRVNKLILLHGPNGSAKSSFVRALMMGLDAYSRKPEGVLYSFNWIFPSAKATKDSIGFGGVGAERGDEESYAYLPPGLIDARLPCEMRDHPIFLLPFAERMELLDRLAPEGQLAVLGDSRTRTLADYFRNADLSYKSKKIFDALLTSYDGDLDRVLNHIQVERYYLSRRYRSGIATIEPQMAVDARIHQITSDRSLASLPKTIQHLSLFEPTGPIVDANRGLLEYSDFLKRPVESFKYLLSTVETSAVTLDSFILNIDLIYIASTNETYLEAFKNHPDFPSFKGRMELVKVPYLRHYSSELDIYRATINEKVIGKHIAPHTVEVAALWAILTRLRKNNEEDFSEGVQEVIRSLTPLEKLYLYDLGEVPERLTTRQAKELKHCIGKIYKQVGGWSLYEGSVGASAREIRTALLNAANSEFYGYLSPLAVFREIEKLVSNTSVYEFLKQEVRDGYHDHKGFLSIVMDLYLRWVDDEICDSMGLAPEESYDALFSRYVLHVSHWVKNEKMLDTRSGQYVSADERFMKQIEGSLLTKSESEKDFRGNIIATIGARALDIPDKKPDYSIIFKGYIRKLRDSFYDSKRQELKTLNQNFLKYASGDQDVLEAKELKAVEAMLDRLKSHHGYTLESARDSVAYLLRTKYEG